MTSITSRYAHKMVNNNYFSKVLVSGTTRNIKEPGYIYAPYIMVQSSPIIVDGMDWVRILREREIKLRREKIEGIIKKINETT